MYDDQTTVFVKSMKRAERKHVIVGKLRDGTGTYVVYRHNNTTLNIIIDIDNNVLWAKILKIKDKKADYDVDCREVTQFAEIFICPEYLYYIIFI